jgi:LysM repeat protein
MRRLPLILAFACTSFFAFPAQAEDSPSAQELHELRQAVEQQSKQIELLAEQVGRLTKALEGQKPSEPAAATAASTTSAEAPKPAPDATSEAPKEEAVPKAEPVAGGTKHAVAKGETLTSIAKHYNISIADLKNTNKIENERKLQIGQILTIPTAKAPETSDKKVNP